MREVSLFFPFTLALLAASFGSLLFPLLSLHTFTPFLAIAYHTSSFTKAIWIAAGSGMIVDLLSSEGRFGLYTLTFILTTLCVYHLKRYFFEDKPLAFSFYTSSISWVATFSYALLLYLFYRERDYSFSSFWVDLFFFSLLDGIYAFLWFTSPVKWYLSLKRKGWRAFFQKFKRKKKLS